MYFGNFLFTLKLFKVKYDEVPKLKHVYKEYNFYNITICLPNEENINFRVRRIIKVSNKAHCSYQLVFTQYIALQCFLKIY